MNTKTTTPSHRLYLANLSYTIFEERAGSLPYWILTVGSIEQHGPHLPLGADALIVERLAEVVAARDGSLILPRIQVGAIHAFREWPHIRLDSPHLVEQALAYTTIVREHGNRLLVLNGHDENHEPLMIAARRLASEFDTEVLVVEWAELVSDIIRDVSSSSSESHAGEALTSLFLYWYPDLVSTDEIAAGAHPPAGLTADDLHVAAHAHHPRIYRRTDVPNGVLGDPRPASAEKGRRIANTLVNRVAELVIERGWR